MNPLISIIIPTYNRSNLIGYTINSIIAQKYTNWECIIIDDGSSDDTCGVISMFQKNEKRIKYFLREGSRLKGPSVCRNYGIKKAKGRFIQFFDDDDLMYPELLLKKVDLLIKKEVDVVVSKVDIFNVAKGEIIDQNNVESDDLIKHFILGKITWYVNGPIWKRKFLQEQFDESVQTLDDWDFNLRNIYNNPKISFINEALCRYNRFGIGTSLSTKKRSRGKDQARSVFFVYKKHYKILKEKELLEKEIKVCLMRRFTFLLRSSLINKSSISTKIFAFIIKEHSILELRRIIAITLGYYSYLAFGRGYRFIKYI
ncbi:glycosyltransferase family 2 protein [Autumnicola musiva]|uniref:Glycosyltransferase family 2 protein n=1 Tax=Autumnicola musiva TaxID=3075589 RepID=A0ABU3D5J2_9FLAO|nr:glycosyltransferase family 2 protein [Zunongwangia sp. F117]MDT0676801.1 glycosyltransferase family 2 protein [Zunongwangia sp. F117]